MVLLRSAHATDDPARDELHLRCFGFAPPAGMWSWKYRENPHGAAIEHVIEDGGAIVAAFALQPRRVTCAGRAWLAFQAADAMTAPAAQRRGHYARLLASAETEARSRGGAFLCAFGGARSNDSFARAGWRELRRTRSARASLRGPRAWWRARGARAEFALVAKERLGAALAAASRDREQGAGERDAAWLAWRTRSARYRGFASASGAVACVEILGARAVLADLAPGAAWQREPELWRGLLAALRSSGVEHAELTLVEGEPLSARAAGAGFRGARRATARPFWWKPLREELTASTLAARELWIRDLDRDAEGLLLRAAAAPEGVA